MRVVAKGSFAVDVRQLIDLAESRPEPDSTGGVVLAGYSMGSWIGSVAGPCDGRIKAMVLMVGGAHDLPPAALLLPQLAAGDPRLAIPHFVPRPILMLSGRRDYTVTPDMTQHSTTPRPSQRSCAGMNAAIS